MTRPESLPRRIGGLDVIRRLGAGGFGVVYLARDPRLERQVALKLAHPGRGDVWREARVAARLAHPNVVSVFEVGDHEGRPFLIMEYIDGPSLRDRLDGNPLETSEVIRILRDLAAALAAAHKESIFHLDLTPANVLLGSDGRTRVVDFGLARRSGDREDMPAGTATYMAPEQWHLAELGAATDVWALGAILHVMVVGAPPIEGSRERIRDGVGGAAPLDLRLDKVPQDLAALVRRCLRKQPSERPSAEEIVRIAESMLRRVHQPAIQPFRGLEAFDEDAASSFHGRDAEIASIMRLFHGERAITIVGASGSGKSSLVFAGIAPALRAEGWTIVSLRPGRRPLTTMISMLREVVSSAAIATRDLDEPEPARRETPELFAAELVDAAAALGGRLVIVVDQLEELETIADPEERGAFSAALALAAEDDGPVRIIVTVRDDFLGRVAARTGGALGRVVVLAPPGPAQLASLIEQPILDAGYRFEDAATVKAIVTEVAGEPGALSLVQSVCVALWDRRDVERRLITATSLDELGGVGGAFANHAQAVLAACTPPQAHVLRVMVLRLLTPQATRRPESRAALLDGLPDAAQEVLERLIAARVVIARVGGGHDELELVHETLATRWPTLARWLDEGRGDRAILAELAAAAGVWDRRSRDAALLWTGNALRDAERVVARSREAPPSLQRDFLAASARRQRSGRRRLNIGVGASAVAVVVTIAVFAIQRRDARVSAALATRRSAEATLQAAWGALSDERMLDARAFLRTSVETDDVEGATELWWRLGFEPEEWQTDSARQLEAIAWTGDGAAVIAGRLQVQRLDLESAEHLDLGEHGDSVMAAATNGGLVLTGGIDGAIKVWNGAPRVLAHLTDPVLALAITDDGAAIAAGDAAGGVTILNAAGVETARFGVPGGATDIAWSATKELAVVDMRGDVYVRDPGGSVRAHRDLSANCVVFQGADLVVGTTDGAVMRLGSDAPMVRAPFPIESLAVRGDEVLYASGRELRSIGSRERIVGRARDTIRSMRISPDGQRVAVLSGARTVHVWRLDAAAMLPERGFAGAVGDVAITHDGATILAAGDDGVLRMFDVRSGAMLRSIATGHGRVRALVLEPDGAAVLTAGDDGTARRWTLPALGGGAVVATHTEAVTALAVNGTGDVFATGSAGRSITLWSRSGGALATFDAGSPIYDVVFDDRGRVISLGDDRRVLRWTTGTPEPEVLYHGLANTSDITVSADRKHLAIVGASPQVILDLERGTRREIATGTERWHYAAFAPDGRLFVSGPGLVARVIDPDGIRPAIDLGARRAGVTDAEFSADGALLVTAGQDGLAGAWTVADGRFAWGQHRAVADTELARRQPMSIPAVRTVELAVGTVMFAGHSDGLVTVRSSERRELIAFRLHGAIETIALEGSAVIVTAVTGDTERIDVSRLRASGCELVAAVRAAVPVAIERGVPLPAIASDRCP